MESLRDIDRVIERWRKGFITASKARGHVEAIVFDGVRVDSIDAADLGYSQNQCVLAWIETQNRAVTSADVAAATQLTRDRASIALSYLARHSKLDRCGNGSYKARVK